MARTYKSIDVILLGINFLKLIFWVLDDVELIYGKG